MRAIVLLLALANVLLGCAGKPQNRSIPYSLSVDVIGLNSYVEGRRLTPGGAWSFYQHRQAPEAAALAEQAVHSFQDSERFLPEDKAVMGYRLAGAVALMAAGKSAGPQPVVSSGRLPRQEAAFARGLQQLRDAAAAYNASRAGTGSK